MANTKDSGWKALFSFLLSREKPTDSEANQLADGINYLEEQSSHKQLCPDSQLEGHLETLTQSVSLLTDHIKRAEEARVRSNYIAKHVSDAYVCFDDKGEVKEINPAFLKIFRLSHLLETDSIITVLHHKELLRTVSFLIHSLRGSEFGTYKELVLPANEEKGEEEAHLSIFKVNAKNAEIKETIIFIKDNTEQKKQESLISSNQKLLAKIPEIKDNFNESWEQANKNTLRLLTLNLQADYGLIVDVSKGQPVVVEEFRASKENPCSVSLEWVKGLIKVLPLEEKKDEPYKVLKHPGKGSFVVFAITIKRERWGHFIFFFEGDKAHSLTSLELNATLAAKEIYEAAVETARTDTELMNTADLNKKILSGLPTPIFVRDQDGKYVSMSDSFMDLMGGDVQEVARATNVSQEMLLDKQIDQQMLIEGQDSYEYQGVLVNPVTAERRVGTIRKTAVKGADHTKLILSSFLDLTEEIRANTSLDALNSKVGSLVGLFSTLDSEGFEKNLQRFLKIFCEHYPFISATVWENKNGKAHQGHIYKREWETTEFSTELLERHFQRDEVLSSFVAHKVYQDSTFINYYVAYDGKILSALSLCSKQELSESFVNEAEFMLVLKVYELALLNNHLQKRLKEGVAE